MTDKLRYRPKAGTNSGKRRGWIKHVTAVDPEGTDGYAVSGEFLRSGTEVELPEGAVILKVNPEGSVNNNWKSAHVLVLRDAGDGSAEEDYLLGGPEKIVDGEEGVGLANWYSDFLSVRDALEEALLQEKLETTNHLSPAHAKAQEIAQLVRNMTAAGTDLPLFLSLVANGLDMEVADRRRLAEYLVEGGKERRSDDEEARFEVDHEAGGERLSERMEAGRR